MIALLIVIVLIIVYWHSKRKALQRARKWHSALHNALQVDDDIRIVLDKKEDA